MIHEVPRPRPARRGLSLAYQGKTLLSTIDPIAQSEKAALTYTVRPRTLYLVVSPLFGYGLPLLINSLPVDSALLAIEADPLLFTATKEEFYRTVPQNIPYISIRSAEDLCGFVRSAWGPRHFRRVELVILNAGWTLNEELYKTLVQALQHDIAIDWSNAMTLTRMGRLYARNTLRNLPALAQSPSLDRLNFGQAPVLIAGAGPSLDEVLDRLLKVYPEITNKAQRSFRIICVDTALQSFIARAIPVDLVVALEAQIWNLKDFIGYGKADFALAMDLSAHPGTIQAAKDEIYFFFTPWTELAFLSRLEQRNLLPTLIPPMGSVGLTATAIALRVTQGPVYIAGLDFAFTAELYHAKSSPGYQRRYCNQTRLEPLSSVTTAFRQDISKIAAKSGRLLLTDRALQRYQDLFIREFRGEVRLTDIRPWGLDLQIRQGTLEELLGHSADHSLAAASGCKTAGTAGRASRAGGEVSTAEGHKASAPQRGDMAAMNEKAAALQALLAEELASLQRLRAILSGEAPAAAGELERLLDYCDYLWAHFPECAAAGRQRPGTEDISFLKRIRAELDYFIKMVELGLTHP